MLSANRLRSPAGTDRKSQLPDQRTVHWFCVAFQPQDKILLFPPSLQIAELLYRLINDQWRVDAETCTQHVYQLKLCGTPFLKHTGREHAILLKGLCSAVLELLKVDGWELVLCTDLSRKTDLTTWYFVRAWSGSVQPLKASPLRQAWSFVCLSLSKHCCVQLINAPVGLHSKLKSAVLTYYKPGFRKEANHSSDYEIILNGSPWDTKSRHEIISALRTLMDVFRLFAGDGYHLYGLVNLKDTADSLFFEYDRTQTSDHDRYMMMTMDEMNVLRLIDAPQRVARAVEQTLREHWGLLEQELVEEFESVASLADDSSSTTGGDADCYEYKLPGTPWLTDAGMIGRSRRLVTLLLDGILACGWTLVTGLDVSRRENGKSALLFQACLPLEHVRHVCISPLNERALQIINAPPDLMRLIRRELQDLLTGGGDDVTDTDDHTTNDDDERKTDGSCKDLGQIFELDLNGFRWDADSKRHDDGYVLVRRRMGALLRKLMEARWLTIASADVAHQREVCGIGAGVHSWFLLYCGCDLTGDVRWHATRDLLRAGARIGSPGFVC